MLAKQFFLLGRNFQLVRWSFLLKFSEIVGGKGMHLSLKTRSTSQMSFYFKEYKKICQKLNVRKVSIYGSDSIWRSQLLYQLKLSPFYNAFAYCRIVF